MTGKKYCANIITGQEILRILDWGGDTMAEQKTLDPIAIGIKKKIVEKGLVQKTVAKRAGYSEQQLSDMLNDRKIIKAVDLFAIAEAIGVDVSDIYAAGAGNTL